MSIKIKVTPEMTGELQRCEEGGAWHQVRAVLDIVERDLNQAIVEPNPAEPWGCIEVED